MTKQSFESTIERNDSIDILTELSNIQHSKKDDLRARPQPLSLTILQKLFKLGETISPTITGRIAYNLWLTPPKFKTPASEQAALQAAEIKYHTILDQSIATYHWGQSGPAVLLVHGWSGRGTQLGSFVKPLLEAGYQVFSFDAPAHGSSSGKQTNLYEFAGTILAMQELFGIFDTVITHSFGGPCTAVAMQKGFVCNHVISICPPATTSGLVDKFCQALNIQKKTDKVIRKNIENSFGKSIWQEVAMINTVKDLKPENLQSVTVIHDAHDIDIPWQEGQAVAFAWNNAPLIITSGLGHRRILRDQGVIKTVLEKIRSK